MTALQAGADLDRQVDFAADRVQVTEAILLLR